jgi:hypothetical protein
MQWVHGAVSPTVTWRGREADLSPPSSAEVKNGEAIPPLPHGVVLHYLRLSSSCEGESVNGSQMDIKRKTCDIRTRKYVYFSAHPPSTSIHMSHRFTSASFDRCLSHFRTWSGIICYFRTFLREFLDPIVNPFTRQTRPTASRRYFFMNTLFIEPFCPQKNA